ncbi:hypothetical protein VF14_20955 [Nostoc linckia z18]|jgi:hypothetical protein|uniref:Uncharacterized protein n=2 Tax=Nostoc linckia TaxID=92942 RepID=A0A9Q6EHD1_NOSLI|nr:hypothetical protein [Nostoc linckia]PHK29151.1 hypothetical protein VF12_31575 [Nostoc linckia z15]PHK39095.1 hypothetical protein VF13_34915 [Nostoc linckia z16]PHJ54195.1 hypothetical protein VF02_36785 [Nostoc linckia z1]PHJ56623.1 hypothetical protein VF03_37375 [Nostoc linckia z2]PHJ71551.1 hypothetical protein VF06_37145 [Nostoc linckia z4]
MSKYRILNPEQSYTFSQYFLLPNPTIDILAEFEYSYARTELELPKYFGELTYLEFLQNYLQRNIKLFNPTAEISIREFLIAPIFAEVCEHTMAQLYSEYPINVNEKLKGTLDYYLYKSNSLLVIEAKQSDIRRGFTQLAVELVALDRSLDSESCILYGAVTNGDDWKFGILHREEKRITEDIKLYRVPEGLEDLLRVLVGILSHEELPV